jgi:hypothetical protein
VIRIPTLLVAFASLAACRSSTGSGFNGREAPRVPALIREQGRFGYIDGRGHVIIPPRFEGARCFHEGRAAVRVGDKYGYIDDTGKTVVAPRFDFADDFSDGVAVVNQGGRWGHFGSDMPEFHGGEWGVVDGSDRFTPFAGVERLAAFHGGIARALVGGRWIYLRRDGSRMDDRPWRDAFAIFDFSEGQAVALTAQGPATITSDGRTIPHPGIRELRSRSEGMTAYVTQGYPMVGFLSEVGARAPIKPRFDDAGPFSEGLAAVLFEGEWGYLDSNGHFAIPPRYADAGRFSEGLAAVGSFSNHLRGYVDRRGDWGIAARFREADEFTGGLAFVVTDEGSGYIDRRGSWVWRAPATEGFRLPR